ncbi:hypothetical protein [Nocardia sp. NPDC052566]|uniref:hypothetical protein n=1 Tax=Nocardia sp. NPDC052566 TaxID=3364330 RepID=UPI0037C80DDA
MGATKVTVTIDDGDLARVRARVAHGEAASVSAYVTTAVAQRLARDDDIALIQQRYGSPSDKALAWARRAAHKPAAPGDAELLSAIDTERRVRGE